eukprot:3638633-Rhodomonas_salina.1
MPQGVRVKSTPDPLCPNLAPAESPISPPPSLQVGCATLARLRAGLHASARRSPSDLNSFFTIAGGSNLKRPMAEH